ncbi:hypothetical protein V2J09_012671 [Rumex salicifolius]
MRYLLRKFDTDIVALFETHAAGERAADICRKVGLENSYRVDAQGQSGGVWLLWRKEVGNVTILNSTFQFIHARVESDGEVTHIFAVYAAPSAQRRSMLWTELKDIVNGISDPVFLGGDFNSIVRVDERSEGNGRLSPDSMEFGNWINELSLVDMGFRGNKFTWTRGRSSATYIAKRLDRVLCNPQARVRWQEATVSHLPPLSSDHVPLHLVMMPKNGGNPARRPFRIEAAWLAHPSFKEILSASWDPNISTPAALNVLKYKLKKRNKEVFGNIFARKERLISEIMDIRSLQEVAVTDTLLAEEERVVAELDLVLNQEELLWLQKSREKWVWEGDRNTSFFHLSTIVRRRRNRIEMLRDDSGSWVTDQGRLEEMAMKL